MNRVSNHLTFMTEYDSYDLFMFSELHVCPYIHKHTRFGTGGCEFFFGKNAKVGKNMGGCQKFWWKKSKIGKNLVVGVILDQFGKMYHTFPGFFPSTP